MAKRRNYYDVKFDPELHRMNLAEVSEALNIPRKLLNRWRKTWLKYPVSEEQFFVLQVLAQEALNDHEIVRITLSRLPHAKRMRIAKNADVPKPVAEARMFLIRQKLKGRDYVRTPEIIEHVRCFYPNGYKLLTPEVMKQVRQYVLNQFAHNQRENLERITAYMDAAREATKRYRKRKNIERQEQHDYQSRDLY